MDLGEVEGRGEQNKKTHSMKFLKKKKEKEKKMNNNNKRTKERKENPREVVDHFAAE